jgi:hypothetical protein
MNRLSSFHRGCFGKLKNVSYLCGIGLTATKDVKYFKGIPLKLLSVIYSCQAAEKEFLFLCLNKKINGRIN